MRFMVGLYSATSGWPCEYSGKASAAQASLTLWRDYSIFDPRP